MKLKQQPEDFHVEELTEVIAGERGAFALYRLEKRGWGTPDALQAVRRRWHINPRRLSYGGLKDRHALTVQYFTVHRGPKNDLAHHGVTVQYLGQVAEPFTSQHIRANRFRITLREIQPEEMAAAQQALEEVRVHGVPNYFDDQRFGSVGEEKEFVARLMILGRYEEALRLALTAPYEHDRAPQKQEKAVLLAHWRDWKTAKAKLPRSHARSLVDYLVSHPTDFRGTLARMRPELRGLYLSAYQSYLWNNMLARWLQRLCLPEQLISVSLRLDQVPMQRNLDESQRSVMAGTTLPLPSARLKITSDDPFAALIEEILAVEGFQLSEMKIKKMHEPFFSKGDRHVLCLPQNLVHETAADDLHPGMQKLIISLDLARGAYVTLIVKRVQESARS
ncbi:MAG TPA: tRNA pseudouridine(13) synthase TruD [Gemmataceae bacterium]|jgi:tRNA pseudouridine13 synthase|nr:tRNA pseudouridine(13) synthase TruD [Gemmataceae bacterium]